MIREQISQLIQDVVDGNESAAKAWSILKDIESVLKNGLSVIEEPARTEAREFNTKEKYYGGFWVIGQTAVQLDFSKDKTFIDLDNKAKARKKVLNSAWKAHNEGKGFFDKESGEEIPILPVKTPSKETLIYKPGK